MLSFQPIQDQRLSDRIAEQFTSAMHNGELTVGTRLPPEAQLAEQPRHPARGAHHSGGPRLHQPHARRAGGRREINPSRGDDA